MTDADEGEGQMLGLFLVEAWDTLATIEEGLAPEAEPQDATAEWAERLSVVAHRLRGSAALYGFPEVSELARGMEQLLAGPPESPAGGTADIMAALRGLAAALRDALLAIGAGNGEGGDALSQATAPPAPASAEAPPAPSGPAGSPPASPLIAQVERFLAENAEILTYFGPEAAEHLETMTQALLALEQDPSSREELRRLFRAAHTLKGAAYTVGFSLAGDVAHRIEDLLAAVQEDRLALAPPVVEAVFAGMDALRALLGGPKGLRSDLPALVEAAMTQLAAAAPSQAEPGAAVPEALPAPRDVAEPAATAGRPAAAPPRPGIRVSLDRLDALMGLVGELVISRSRLERRLVQLERVGQLLLFTRGRMGQVARDLEASEAGRPEARQAGDAGNGPPADSVSRLLADLDFERYDDSAIRARSIAEIAADTAEVQAELADLIRSVAGEAAQIQRLTAGLRGEITRARMVPVGTLFARCARQVREAARVAGTQVVLEVHGETVEVDNSVIEQLADPLLHLLRNAVAHGIEPEDERRARGKPAHGTVCLSAYHQGGAIYVEVEDDGRGMDPRALQAEAVRRGFLTGEAAAALPESEALQLIFLPGFSTAAQVTAAAGRGVGMDVVRTNIRRLNGDVGVETEVGVGTRFTIKLPLTVIIADALFVRVATETFAIPLTAVAMIRMVGPGEVQATGPAEMIRVEDQLVDLLRLDRVLALTAPAPRARTPVVVLRAPGRLVALAVDELVGKEEIVIKSLGDFLEGVGPFAGATITGDGRIILLLDPARLLAAGSEAGGAHLETADAGPGPEGAGPLPAAGERPRILLVDDSISVRKFVAQMLQRGGFEVVTAMDGAEALARLGEAAFQAVITDLEMPRMNGYELIEELRRRPSTRAVPVVVLTTRAGGKHLGLAQQLGVQHYVTKPADEEALVRLMASLVAGRPALSALVAG
jgi:chemosensory pili system protein ChpA (sensor histidine kinase/response regulator)